MGYQITFVPSEEAMEPYKFKNLDTALRLEKARYDLIDYIMKDGCGDRASQQYDFLRFRLGFLFDMVEEDEKKFTDLRWSEDPDHELRFSGWEFSKNDFQKKEDVVDYGIEHLIILSDLVKTPDYFENHEHFCDKLDEVKILIHDFIESARTSVSHMIVNDLDNFKKATGDESLN